MIRLIASDLDGTILQRGVPDVGESLMSVIGSLLDKGIIFVPASGRQLYSLKQLFKPFADKLMYICENGALVKYKEKTIAKTPMDRQLAMDIINDIYAKDNCEVLIAGENTSYIRPKSQSYKIRMTQKCNYSVTLIDDFNDIKDDILKISVCDERGIGYSSEYFQKRWSGKTQTAVSDVDYMDFTDLTVSKGNAMKHIQESLNISPDECMAFGDNFNDVTMLDSVAASYAMEAAADGVKKHARFTTSSVEKTLRSVFELVI